MAGETMTKQSMLSLNLNFSESFCFARLQENRKRCHYSGSEELKIGIQRFLRQLSKPLLLRVLKVLKNDFKELSRQRGV